MIQVWYYLLLANKIINLKVDFKLLNKFNFYEK